jgi:hypothetical protein
MAQDSAEQTGLDGLVGMAKAGTRTQLALIHTLYGGRSVLNHLHGALTELEPADMRQLQNVLRELTAGARALLVELERVGKAPVETPRAADASSMLAREGAIGVSSVSSTLVGEEAQRTVESVPSQNDIREFLPPVGERLTLSDDSLVDAESIFPRVVS